MSFLQRALHALARRLPLRVIVGREHDPYLCKYKLAAGERWRLHLHRFVRSDEDHELHSHPWTWSVGLILWGGYREEYEVANRAVALRAVLPGRLNVIFGDTFHRVELIERECWTLFLSGPVHGQSWGFKDRLPDGTLGAFRPWRAFVRAKGLSDGPPTYLAPGDPRRGWLDEGPQP